MYGWLRTEAQYVNWLRSSLRRVWSKHPIKQVMEQKARFKHLPKGAKTPTFHIRCEHCKIPHKLKMIECNHKGNASGSEVLSLKNMGEFAQKLLVVTEQDLELLCKKCHSIITYSERSGMNYADSLVEKKVIKFGNLKAPQQKAKLKLAGIGENAKNETQRKDAVREYLKARR
jgi:hypothetical protein